MALLQQRFLAIQSSFPRGSGLFVISYAYIVGSRMCQQLKNSNFPIVIFSIVEVSSVQCKRLWSNFSLGVCITLTTLC